MTTIEIVLIALIVITTAYLFRLANKKVKQYKVNVKQDDYIWLKCNKTGNRYRYMVKNVTQIREFCSKFASIKCYVFKNANDVIDFDGSLIEFFIDHVQAGNQAATFDVEAAKKLQASNRKFDY
jgi:hypothetical protein